MKIRIIKSPGRFKGSFIHYNMSRRNWRTPISLPQQVPRVPLFVNTQRKSCTFYNSRITCKLRLKNDSDKQQAEDLREQNICRHAAPLHSPFFLRRDLSSDYSNSRPAQASAPRSYVGHVGRGEPQANSLWGRTKTMARGGGATSSRADQRQFRVRDGPLRGRPPVAMPSDAAKSMRESKQCRRGQGSEPKSAL